MVAHGYGAGGGGSAVHGRVARAPSVSGSYSGGDDSGEDEEDGNATQEEAPPEAYIPDGPDPYTGRMATVMDAIAAGKVEAGLDEALAWRGEDPGDVLALIALGEAFEARGDTTLAGRAYGSIIDLFPGRADLRRFAGERLDRLTTPAALELAIDAYRRAVEQRPDHLTGHRLLAFALVRAGKLEDAFAALEAGIAQPYPDGRFAEGGRILREDLGLVAAAWQAKQAKKAPEIKRRLTAAGAKLETDRSMRFVLTWETDANDVDFHIHDAKRGHAYYEAKTLPSGGELYADVTTGYGPECFTIRGKPTAAPYHLSIHYYSRGPMGYGMGKLEILRHDGKGTLTVEQRPFVVMNDGAFVDLGEVE
jgi:tetratricopeptide (TPR) repeat protein